MKLSFPVIERAKLLLQPFSRRVNLDVLLALADPHAPLRKRIEWLQDVIDWLRSPLILSHVSAAHASVLGISDLNLPFGKMTPLTGKEKRHKQSRKQHERSLQNVRLRYAFQLLERNPEWKSKVAEVLRSIFLEASAADLFGSTGLNRESGFFSEIFNRLQRKILPAAEDDRDFSAVFARIFRDDSDANWIRALPMAEIQKLAELLRYEANDPDQVFSALLESMIDALLILGPAVSSTGLRPDLRIRMDDRGIENSPFYALNESLFALVPLMREREKGGTTFDVNQISLLGDLLETVHVDIEDCRERIKQVYRHLEDRGVSVALVFRLESLSAALSRIKLLLEFLNPEPGTNEVELARTFTADLVQRSIEATKIRRVFGENLDLLSRKIVERVGYAGDHYIAAKARDYWRMLASGGGGGVVTIFTTFFKSSAMHAGFPLFFEGFFVALNYSASFLLMQACHFSLATKQPSMTATTLANKLVALNHRRQLEEFVDEVARITRTQFAAALGNVGLVVPGAILFNLLYERAMGHPVFGAEYAQSSLMSFHPFKSITIPAAALTGVILWFSAICGGWLENWAVFRRIPEALNSNRALQVLFGPTRTLKISKVFAREIAGIGSNVSIGILLAFTPVVGKFFGLPIDIRHVTLSSGYVAFAVSSLGWANTNGWSFAMACLGVFCMLILNFGVAYSLALIVALRAKRIKKVWVYHLLKAVGRRIRTRGLQFLFPAGGLD